jgi:PTH2 family peptidyl-tRNA hydrolase
MSYKQVILVRTDLKMSKGKISAQVAHAAVQAASSSNKENLKSWKTQGMKKVVLKVKNKQELLDYQIKAKQAKLKIALITDAGRTQIPKNTITCLAIGPDKEEKIDKITGKIKQL